MKIKKGADIKGLNIHMRPALIAANKIWKNLNQELVITSGLDSTHSAGSLHYYGRAIDVRTYYFSTLEKTIAYESLKKALGKDFYIKLETDHIHIGYDPKN